MDTTKRKDDRRPPWGGGREREKQAPDAVTALAFTSSKTRRRSWVRAVGTEEAVDDEAGLAKKRWCRSEIIIIIMLQRIVLMMQVGLLRG